MSIVDNAGGKVDKIFKLNTFMIAHKKKMIMKDYVLCIKRMEKEISRNLSGKIREREKSGSFGKRPFLQLFVTSISCVFVNRQVSKY